jgi:hypothetical protein
MNLLNSRALLRSRQKYFSSALNPLVGDAPHIKFRKSRVGFSKQVPVQLTEETFEELKRKNRAVHGKRTNKYVPTEFLGTKDEEFELQRTLMETSWTDVDVPMEGDGKAEVVEKFKKYWVQCSQTIQVYFNSDIEEEKHRFEEVCLV